ncbi:hypothetical protein [Paenibacillus sp. FSL E2-0201]|uniref:hypothetical protein n=1 Tax=Paenibacillus sp. FSL E2-0201 TaxID=2954726 RepID=UPI0030DD8E75
MNEYQPKLKLRYEQKEALYTDEEISIAENDLDKVIRYILDKLIYAEVGNK